MAKGLTRKQQAILEFIIQCIRDNGMPPTIAEIGDKFGITSTNGVNDHLVALEKKGYIERSSKARSIHVLEKAGFGKVGRPALDRTGVHQGKLLVSFRREQPR